MSSSSMLIEKEADTILKTKRTRVEHNSKKTCKLKSKIFGLPTHNAKHNVDSSIPEELSTSSTKRPTSLVTDSSESSPLPQCNGCDEGANVSSATETVLQPTPSPSSSSCLQSSSDVCRDFLRGECLRIKCKFLHPVGREAELPSCTPQICHLFNSTGGNCPRTACKFLHVISSEAKLMTFSTCTHANNSNTGENISVDEKVSLSSLSTPMPTSTILLLTVPSPSSSSSASSSSDKIKDSHLVNSHQYHSKAMSTYSSSSAMYSSKSNNVNSAISIANNNPSSSSSNNNNNNICRDYMQGKCERGFTCKYRHLTLADYQNPQNQHHHHYPHNQLGEGECCAGMPSSQRCSATKSQYYHQHPSSHLDCTSVHDVTATGAKKSKIGQANSLENESSIFSSPAFTTSSVSSPTQQPTPKEEALEEENNCLKQRISILKKQVAELNGTVDMLFEQNRRLRLCSLAPTSTTSIAAPTQISTLPPLSHTIQLTPPSTCVSISHQLHDNHVILPSLVSATPPCSWIQ